MQCTKDNVSALKESCQRQENHCLYYTVFLILIKFILSQKIITIIIDENDYKEIIDYLHSYKIGFKYHSKLFSAQFVRYIIFDILTE